MAKLILDDQDLDTWSVVGVLTVDTKDDKNIRLNSIHETTLKSFFVPTNLIKNFIPIKTKKIKRYFNPDTGLESWEAI